MSAGTLLLVALPAVATLGEGGASALGLVLWHALFVALAISALLDGAGAGVERERRGLAVVPLGAWFLFLGVAALGALRVSYAYAAWLNAVELSAVTVVAVLAARRGPGLIRLAVWPLALAALAQSLLALFQRFAQGQPRPAGTFLNPNHLGGFLVVVLLLLIGEALVARERRARLAALGLALPAVAALLLSGSRGALLAGSVGGVWLVLGAWSRLDGRRRLAAIAVFALAAAPIGLRVAQRLQDTDPYMFHRVKIWRASAGPLLESPLWGSGPGQFAIAAARFQFDDGHGPLRFDRAFRISHSDLLRVPVEYGLPAALILVSCVFVVVREARKSRGTPDAVGSPGVAAALLAVAAHALVDNPSSWPALYLLVALLLGTLLSRRTVGHRRASPLVRGVLAAILALVFLVGEVGPTVAYLKAAGLPQGRLSEAQLRTLDLASMLNPVQPGPRLQLADHLIAGDGPLGLGDYVEAREAVEHAIRLSPRDSRYHWGLARVEGQACIRLFHTEASRDRTYERLERAQELATTDTRISLHAAEFGLAVGDPIYARRMAEQALRLEPQAVAGHLLLARALLAHDPSDGTRAAALVERAVRIAVEHAAVAKESGYARVLLTLNPERLAGLPGYASPAEPIPVAE